MCPLVLGYKLHQFQVFSIDTIEDRSLEELVLVRGVNAFEQEVTANFVLIAASGYMQQIFT